MKGTYVERDRKKEKKKPKTTESGGSKKGAAAGMAGVPAAMPVSLTTTEVFLVVYPYINQGALGFLATDYFNVCHSEKCFCAALYSAQTNLGYKLFTLDKTISRYISIYITLCF